MRNINSANRLCTCLEANAMWICVKEWKIMVGAHKVQT